jgi:hypothetical protein
MTNDTFLNEMYDDDDINDSFVDPNDELDDCDEDEWIDDPQGSYSPYSSPYYGPGYGSYYPQKSEPTIAEGLLKALLASHAREIALLKQINKELRATDKAKNKLK